MTKQRIVELENALDAVQRLLRRLSAEDHYGELEPHEIAAGGTNLCFARDTKRYAVDARTLLNIISTADGRAEALRVELELAHLRKCRTLLSGLLDEKRPEWEDHFAVYEQQLDECDVKIRELEAMQV